MQDAVIIIAKYFILIPIVSYVVLAVFRRHNLKELAIFTILSAILAVVFIKIATLIHSDPRPFISDGVKPYFTSAKDNGFPSDHTALSSAVAFIVFKYNKLAGVFLTVVAFVIGAARVISGVHHTQDVIGAVIIALAAVAAGNYIFNRLMSHISTRKASNQ